MGSLDDRISHLEFELPPDLEGEARRSERRAWMLEHLAELGAAKHAGRPPAPWAEAITEALERRSRRRERGH